MDTSILEKGQVFVYESFELVLFENPGRILTRWEVFKLADALVEPSSDGFGHTVKLTCLVKRISTTQKILIIALVSGEPVGFCSASTMLDEKSIYLDGIVLSSESQGLGIGSALFELLIKVTNCSVLSFTTQNPVMYLLLSRFAKTVYPNLVDNIPYAVKEHVKDFYEPRGINPDKDTLSVNEMYSYPLYPVFPWSGNEEVDEVYKRFLRFGEDGNTTDGFVLYGVF